MDFDQIGVQHVSRRRKPSPLKNTKHPKPVLDTAFSQKVWPRQSRPAHAGDTRREEAPVQQKRNRSAGFSIPGSWIKNMAIVGGVLVIAVIGPNWEGISELIKRPALSPEPFSDQSTTSILEAAVETAWPWNAEAPLDEAEETVADIDDIPLNLTETFSWTEYKVKQGDTISGIASHSTVSAESIIAFNGIKEAWNLKTGKILKIPNMDGIPYSVEKNDNLSKIAVKMKVPLNAILDANNIASDSIIPGEILFIPGARMDANEFNRAYRREVARRTSEKPMIYPIPGSITSGYGWRVDPVRPNPDKKTFHFAIDLLGNTGDSVKAAMKGTVLNTAHNPNLGNFIILQHDGYQTVYAHLSAFSVKVGDRINQGQEIGKVGNTGYTTNPHLHFEVFRDGKRINPLEVLK